MFLKKITIDGFRTFRQRQVIVMPEGPGLYLMRGENLVDTNLQGNDCIAGDSLIYDPVQDKHLRVDQIKSSFHVRSYNPSTGVEETGYASKPFIRGRDNLYRIGLSSGESFVCTEKHIVLDVHGTWVQVGQLRVGDVLLPSCGQSYLTESLHPFSRVDIEQRYDAAALKLHRLIVDHQRTTFATTSNPTALNIQDVCIRESYNSAKEPRYPLLFSEDAFHLFQTVGDYLSRCFVDHRQCDEQLQLVSDTGQATLPLLNDVLGYNPLLLCVDDLVCGRGHSHPYLYGDHLSSDHFDDRAHRGGVYDNRCGIRPLIRFWHWVYIYTHMFLTTDWGSQVRSVVQRFLYMIGHYLHTTESSDQSATERGTCFTPSIRKGTRVQSLQEYPHITTIEFVGQDLFYDLKVWPHPNYELAGVYHHNCGKSTFLDAIVWGLFGTTTRGLRAGNVISWGSKKAVVQQTWQLGDRQLTVKRQQNPNGVWLDGDRIEGAAAERAIRDALGISEVEFLHSVLVGQFTSYFLDLSPMDKLALFSDVLDLDYWEARSIAAKKKAAAAEGKATDWETKSSVLEGRLQELEEQRRRTAKDLRQWSDWQQDEQKDLQRKQRHLQKELSQAVVAFDKVIRKGYDADRVLDEAKVALQRSQYKSQYDSAASLSRLRELKENRQRTTCPFCKRKLTTSWLDALDTQIKEVTRQCKASGNKRARPLKVAFEKATAKSACAEHLIGLAREARQRLQSELQVTNDQTRAENVNPRVAELERAKRLLKDCVVEHTEALECCDRYRSRQKQWAFWVKGFRDLRLWVLDATLTELEMRVNNSLVQLGLDRWLIRMAVERETKSGGVSKGFVVDIKSPDAKEMAPWRGWGGGVTQRLKIATEIGLSRMITDRKGIDLGIELWDEPTQHLSEQGVLDLLMHLQDRARDEQRQIWIVDHRVLDFGFDGGLQVTKTKQGSTVAKF